MKSIFNITWHNEDLKITFNLTIITRDTFDVNGSLYINIVEMEVHRIVLVATT
jgi:hypothetical protein